MASTDINHLIMKLQGIQKLLGGPMQDLTKKESDEFNRIKLALAEGVNYITKKQDERDEIQHKTGRNMAVIKAGCEIKDKLDDCGKQLEQMKEALRRQRKNPKKFPAEQIEVKEKQYENCRKMVEQLNIREEGGVVDQEDRPITLTEMKIKLGGNRDRNAYNQRELNQEESDALRAFKEKDKELDAIILQIDEGLGNLKNKALMIGDAIDNQENMIGDLDKEVAKTVNQLEGANARLKKVLYQYRAPSKFCMDVVCLLILLGLIGVIIKLATSSGF